MCDELGKMIASLTQAHKKVYLVLGANGEMGLDPKMMISRGFDRTFPASPPVISNKEYLRNNGKLIALLTEAAHRNGAILIDPLKDLCLDGIWIANDEAGPIRIDPGHLRPSYVREHVKYLDETVAP
jgi:hypothetical protein